jgi:hypothetical protein
VLNVSSNRERGSVHEARIKAAINDLNDLSDSGLAGADAIEDGLLTHAPMQHVGFDRALRLEQTAAVPWEVNLV